MDKTAEAFFVVNAQLGARVFNKFVNKSALCACFSPQVENSNWTEENKPKEERTHFCVEKEKHLSQSHKGSFSSPPELSVLKFVIVLIGTFCWPCLASGCSFAIGYFVRLSVCLPSNETAT